MFDAVYALFYFAIGHAWGAEIVVARMGANLRGYLLRGGFLLA